MESLEPGSFESAYTQEPSLDTTGTHSARTLLSSPSSAISLFDSTAGERPHKMSAEAAKNAGPKAGNPVVCELQRIWS